MKVTFKLKDTEQLTLLLNFIQELKGKDFKQVKVKIPKAKNIEVKDDVILENDTIWFADLKTNQIQKDEEVLKFPEIKELKSVDLLKEFPKVKFEKGGINHSNNDRNIHGEGLRCHPNCVNGLIYNTNEIVKICDKCNKCNSGHITTSTEWEINKNVCKNGCYIDYGTKAALKKKGCKCNINVQKMGEYLNKSYDKQKNMYFGSASVIPNKAWIDENN